MTTSVSTNSNGDFGYTFVGSYLNQCAKVESWTISILEANIASSDSVKLPKVPHLFGQKLKAIIDLTQNKPELFSKPKRVIELMERFSEPAKLRSNLAHAIVTTTSNEKGSFYLFRNPGTNEQFWFSEDQMREKLTELKKLVKEVTDQKLKATTPPSSPPRPSPAATAGP